VSKGNCNGRTNATVAGSCRDTRSNRQLLSSDRQSVGVSRDVFDAVDEIGSRDSHALGGKRRALRRALGPPQRPLARFAWRSLARRAGESAEVEAPRLGTRPARDHPSVTVTVIVIVTVTVTVIVIVIVIVTVTVAASEDHARALARPAKVPACHRRCALIRVNPSRKDLSCWS
jgi:hypothetical protein